MQQVKTLEKQEAKLRDQVYAIAEEHGYQVETDNWGQLILYTGALHQAWQRCPQCLGADDGDIDNCDNDECECGVIYTGRNQ